MPSSSNLAQQTSAQCARPRVVELPVAFSDALIVRGVLDGRQESVAQLFDRYGDHVQRVITRVMGPDPDVLDLVQDVFLTALSSIHKLSDPHALKAWLTQIAVFSARGRIRRRQRWRFLVFRPTNELPEQSARHASEEVGEALRAAYAVLNRMDADERIPFTLRFIDGMELTSIADACGVSLATIKRRLAKAQRRFKELAAAEPSLAEWLEGSQP